MDWAKLHKYDILLCCLIILVIVANVSWLFIDTQPTPIRGDENIMMARTFSFIDHLSRLGLSADWDSLLHNLSFGGRHPLYQLMAVPFVLAFGRTTDSGVYVNLLFYVVLVLFTFKIGKHLRNETVGLLAALIVVAYPSLVISSRIYRPLFALAACTALTLYYLLVYIKSPSVRGAWLLNLSIAFGSLLHLTYLWGIPVSAAFIQLMATFNGLPKGAIRGKFAWLIGKAKEPLFLYGVLPSAISALFLIFSWYLSIDSPLLGTYSIVPRFLGFENQSFPLVAGYFLTAPYAISFVLAVLLLGGIFRAFKSKQYSYQVLAYIFLSSFIICSLQQVLGWRYFMQMLPVGALMTAVWITDLYPKKISYVLFVTATVVSVFNFSVVTFGLSPLVRPLATALGASDRWCEPVLALYCPSPPKNVDWPPSRILGLVLEDEQCTRTNICKIAVISQTPYLSIYVFDYYMAEDFPKSKLELTGIGWSWLHPFNYMGLLEADYILVQDTSGTSITQNEYPFYDTTYPYYDAYVDVALEFIKFQYPHFSVAHAELERYDLPDGTEAILIKRLSPVTAAETDEIRTYLDSIQINFSSVE